MAWPPNFTRPLRCPHNLCKFILYQPWEMGHIPLSWIKPMIYADAIFAESTFHADMIINDSGVHASKVKIIPHGVTCQTGRSQKLNFLRRRFGISKQAVVFTYIGGLLPRKGVDVLIAAWLQFMSQRSNEVASVPVFLILKISYVDHQEALDKLYSLSKNRKNCILVLYSNYRNINDIYDASDVLVHLARAEGFGLTPLEGLARGLVVITLAKSASKDFLSSKYAIRLPSVTTACTQWPCKRNFFCVYPNIAHTKWNVCEELVSTPFWEEISVKDVSRAFSSLANPVNLKLWSIKAQIGKQLVCNLFSWTAIADLLLKQLILLMK